MKINKDIRNINLKGDEQTQKQLLNKNIRNRNKKRTSIKLDSFSKNSLLTLNNKSSNFVDKKQLKGDKLDFGKEPSPNVDIKNIIFNVNQNKKNAFSKKKLKENRKNLFRFNKNKKNKRDSIVSMETIVGKENKKNKNLNNLSQTDEDLQDMDYEEAIKYDKRSIFKIYWSFLVDSQIILGTFCTDNFLNLFVIKLSFFIFTFEISFFLNALFDTDEYISDAYINNGVLDFIVGLPKAIYSFIATLITTNLLQMLSNSKSELLKIIRENSNNKNYINLIKVKLRKLRIKLIFYFMFVFILGVLFLYYVTAFCAVYRYSQKYWFYGCLESFGMDSLVSLIVCIILAFFRFISIKKRIKCFFVLANIISIFF